MRVLWLCLMLLVATHICGPIVDPDLWWHITVGRWIIAHGKVPDLEQWNQFALGQPWRAYSWSVEVLLALVDRHFGDHGLLVLKLCMAIVLTASMMFCLGKIANNWFLGGALGLLATLASHNHFTLRPQTLSWILLIWLIWLADLIDKQGLNRLRAATLFGVMIIWANSNLTSILGVVTVSLWIYRPDRLRLTGKVVVLMVLATLITPYFGAEWLTFFSKTGHPFKYSSIAEFQAATVLQYSTGFLIIMFALLLLWLHNCPRVLSLAKLLLAFIFVLAALAVIKFIPFACIIIAALTARLWHDSLEQRQALGPLADGFTRLELLLGKIAGHGLGFLLFALTIIQVYPVWREPVSQEVVPVQALDFIIENNLPRPLLSDFGRGGYVMYRLSAPDGTLTEPVVIDGRTNVTPPDVMTKFRAAFDGRPNWREFVELANPGTILWRSDSPLTTILVESGEWRSIFKSGSSDRGYQVFVRRVPTAIP